ncbi:hypothetical protein [Prauserella muralis]|uniref:hypothetical protein n=1 Tax=Prauserella muralis TaxID=588067 RepID=UPI001B87DA4A|nr:hypothetical protein [Prauserella muralis]
MTGGIVHMGAMGLLVSVAAPVLVLATRERVPWRRVPAPPAAVLPGFVVLHGIVTIVPAHWHLPAPVDGLLHAVLLAGAVVFWLPVVGPRRPGEAARAVYLFLAGPSLDLAAIYLIIQGDSAGGLAMIVGMLPIGLAAMAVTWRWITEEERHAW